MADVLDIYTDKPPTDVTPAEPVPTWGEYFTSSSRAGLLNSLGDVSENAAYGEAYEARRKEIKTVTGVDLDNPVYGGYLQEARRSIRQDVIARHMASIDEPDGIPQRQRQLFDQKARELQEANPLLQLGNIDEEARAIAKKAAEGYAHVSSSVGGPGAGARFVLDTAAGFYANRRNPMFYGSLFAGPSTAVGKAALARLANGAMGQFGAGFLLTLADQPGVQRWRAQLGQETGVVPALEEAAWAGLLGMIPGVAIHLGIEATPALRRLVKGQGKPGDVKTVTDNLPVPEPTAKAMQFGEDAIEADKAILPTHEETQAQTKLPIDESLHNDMMGAELKRADDPEAPSAAAVHAIDTLQRPEVSSDVQFDQIAANKKELANIEETLSDPVERKRQAGTGMFEHLEEQRDNLKAWLAKNEPPAPRDGDAAMLADIEERVKTQRPRTVKEAQRIADEVVTDHGRANGIASTEEAIEAERMARAEHAATAEQLAEQHDESDKLRLVPWIDDDGKPRLVTEKYLRQLGNDEDRLAELVKACV